MLEEIGQREIIFGDKTYIATPSFEALVAAEAQLSTKNIVHTAKDFTEFKPKLNDVVAILYQCIRSHQLANGCALNEAITYNQCGKLVMQYGFNNYTAAALELIACLFGGQEKKKKVNELKKELNGKTSIDSQLVVTK